MNGSLCVHWVADAGQGSVCDFGRTTLMKLVDRSLALAAVTAIAVSTVTAVRADDRPNTYVVTNLVSDLPNTAAVQDPNLKNPWGVAFRTIVPLVVAIPCPPAAGQGSSCPQFSSPNGLLWNPTTTVSTAFLVPGTQLPASFISFRGRDDIRLDRRPHPA